jgi:hypothetical protein
MRNTYRVENVGVQDCTSESGPVKVAVLWVDISPSSSLPMGGLCWFNNNQTLSGSVSFVEEIKSNDCKQ